MPKTFDRAKTQIELPKMRRRIGRETTELMITTLALMGTAGLVEKNDTCFCLRYH